MCEYMILEDYKMKQYIYNEQNGLWYELWGEMCIRDRISSVPVKFAAALQPSKSEKSFCFFHKWILPMKN